jgi:uncharacterized lipoprotein YddW (UPF0748 family)
VKRANSAVRIVCAAVSLLLVGAGSAFGDLTADQTPFHTYRGIWVDRFDYSVANAPTSIRTIMQNSAALGITDVMFQVRGQADAYYWNNNGLEVRANGVTQSNDPLAIAIAEGHARGIQVHAWINAMPLWNAQQTGATTYSPTAPAAHLINTNPDFRIRDKNGNPLPFPTGTTGYTIVNPARPDVQTHITNVVKAISGNYAVDGVHLDYIRLYSSNPGSTNVLEYPGDAFTVSLFQQQYPGQTPETNPANFKAFMAGRITDLVSSIRETTKANRPGAQLTAAVWRDADIGLDEYQQDWARWVDSGLLDAAMPMIYRKGFGTGGAGMDADPGDLYRLNVTEGLNRRATSGVMVGVGNYMQNDAATAYANVWNQLIYAKAQGANGVQLFDYGTLFNGSSASNETKRAISDFFAANSGSPVATNLGNFEADEGSFKWSITQSGSNQNVAASSTADRVSGESHSPGTGSQRIVINKTAGAGSFLARHLSGTTTGGDFASNTPFASIGSVGFWLKTSTPDLQVSLAVDDTVTGDRGYQQNVVADGQWHKYEWFLADPTHWDAWVGGSDGHLSTITALDSIQFFGTADSNTIFLDDVFYDAGARAANQWTFDANGAWNNSAHWTGGVPNGVGKVATLLRRGTGNRTVTLDGPVTLGTLTIDNVSSYTIAGGGANQLTMDDTSGTARISVINRGAHLISAPVTINDTLNVFVDRGAQLSFSGAIANLLGRAINKSGDGVLEVSGTQSNLGGSTFSAVGGTTRFNINGGSNLSFDVRNSAGLELRANQTILGLSVADEGRVSLAAGKKVLAVKNLSISGEGKLDLSDGGLVQDWSPAAVSPLMLTRGWIRDGAIVSSAASGTMALGYGEASTILGIPIEGSGTFMGQAVDGSSVLVRLTLRGDAGLDGAVSFSDLVALAQHYGEVGGGTVWTDGDFTLDGNVDFSDLVALAQNYGGAMPASGVFGAGFEADLAAAFAAVPEPSIGVVGLAGCALVGRRRRR